MEWETDREIRAALAAAQFVAVKRDLSQKVKLCIYWTIYVQTPSYSHKLWVVCKFCG